MRNEYVVVHVDIDGGTKNADLYQHYKMPPSMPSLTVLDAAGEVVAGQAAGVLVTKTEEEEGEQYDAKQLQEFLTTHKAEPLNAETVLNAALAEAAKTERGVLLHFGAPWCGWCLKLDAWLEQPRIAEIMSQDFVDVKIDLDRMTRASGVAPTPDERGDRSAAPLVDDAGAEVISTVDSIARHSGGWCCRWETDCFTTKACPRNMP